MPAKNKKSKNKKIPKLRFPEFSGAWEERRLGEVGDIITGTTPPTAERDFYGDEFMFISPADIGNKRYIRDTKNKLSKLGFGYGRGVRKNATLFVCIGSTIGKVAQADRDCSTNQQINSIESNKNNLDDFIFYRLLNDSKKIKLLAGTQAVPQLNKTQFSSLKFCFPILKEQQKIAGFLGGVDEWIENLRAEKEKMEEYKKGMMQKIFDFSCHSRAGGNPENCIRFKDDNGKNFPDWEEKGLGEIKVFVSDGNYGEMYPKASEMKDTGVPFIRANNIKDLKVVWDDMKYIGSDLHKMLQSGHLKKGDILVTTRGEIGMLAYVDEEFDDANINAQICLLRCGNDILPRFLLNYLSSRIGQKQFKELQTGSALKQLPKGNLSKIKINLPSLPEQQKIAEFLTSLDNLIELKEKQITQAEEWKKGLMQGLFV
ncbi:MAG: restriction endonuclease subunit S [Patescibacteria group bacterium]|nr:restriction endonuclease subunit S [Patescibacteria group bacterium]